MKKQNRFKILTFLLSTFLVSCSESMTNSSFLGVGEREVIFKFGILSVTRTTTSDNLKTVFVDDDQIGVWGIKRGEEDVIHTNLKYEYNKKEEKWSAEQSVTFPVDGSNLNFYAYYPYNAEIKNTSFEFAVKQDQSVEERYNQSDLLLAVNDKATVEDTFITLAFSHQLALVEVNVELPESETVVKVDICAKKTATVDLVNQTVYVKEDEVADYITMLEVGEGKFRAVVPAQNVITGKVFRIVTTDGEVNYTYWYKVSSPIVFELNKINVFSISC